MRGDGDRARRGVRIGGGGEAAQLDAGPGFRFCDYARRRDSGSAFCGLIATRPQHPVDNCRAPSAIDHRAVSRYICRMDIGTRLNTWLHGREVGRDAVGNIYYEDKRGRTDGPNRRWVAFVGESEASAVPPEWHAWLHYTVDSPLAATGRAWQKPHVANPT
eukprot:gene51127-69572_t